MNYLFAIHTECGVQFSNLCKIYGIPVSRSFHWDECRPESYLGRDFGDYIHLGVCDMKDGLDWPSYSEVRETISVPSKFGLSR
jgi:hypothetical protein